MMLTPTQRVQRWLEDGSAIPSGEYVITAPLTLTAQDGAIVRPTGRRVTLLWQGPEWEQMFVVTECANPSFRDLDVRIERRCSTFMRVWRTGVRPASARPSTGLHLKDVRVYGQGHLLDGVSFLTENGVDANNEHAAFERVDLYDFVNRGVAINHKQSKEHYFEHCRFGSTGAQFGVSSVSGFNWDKGAFYGMVPFRLWGGGGDRVSIRDASAENCPRFLVQDHATSDPWQILLDGVTYRANALEEDGEWVQVHNAGPLNVVNCQVGGGKMPRVPVIGVKNKAMVRVTGNLFDAFGADLVCPVRGDAIMEWGLNRYTRGEGLDPRTLTIGAWGNPQVSVPRTP